MQKNILKLWRGEVTLDLTQGPSNIRKVSETPATASDGISDSARLPETWDRLMALLDEALHVFAPPAVTREAEAHQQPFRVLVATLVSLRTRDDVTETASNRLFALADTPEALLRIPLVQIVNALRPANFYPTKSARLLQIAQILVDQYQGKVPADMDALLALPGVGRKTANLVLTEGFDLPGVCVDTHVHRIPNRLGLLCTKDPAATETALRKVLPQRYWKPINTRMVMFGQRVCTPQSPHCSTCPLSVMCEHIGVERSR